MFMLASCSYFLLFVQLMQQPALDDLHQISLEATHFFIQRQCIYMCVCYCLSLVCTGASTTLPQSSSTEGLEVAREQLVGWECQCKSFAVAALHERLILLSPSLCARGSFFCVGKRKRRKRHSKDGEVARQTKEAFQRTFPSLYHGKRGKAGLEGDRGQKSEHQGKLIKVLAHMHKRSCKDVKITTAL